MCVIISTIAISLKTGCFRMRNNFYFDFSDLKFLGENVIIGKMVRIRKPEMVSIGDNTIIDDFTYISCSMDIGKCCHIASHVSISGGDGKLIMGDYSTLSNHCSVYCASSDYKNISMDLPSIPIEQRYGGVIENVTIGNYVTVGSHCCILPGSILPNYTAFGAYTLINNKDLIERHLYAGIKCQKDLGERNESSNIGF